MTLTVHEAKRVHGNLVDAFDNALSYLEHHPELAAKLQTARDAATRLASTEVSGRSADAIDAATAAALQEAVTAGRAVLADSDLGRKISRFQRWIDEADQLLAES